MKKDAMTDMLSDQYWQQEFDITEADLDRIAERIRKEESAFDLTTLAKRVVQGRLRFGHELSQPVLSSWTGRSRVRLWDPAEQWAVGDRVIVARRVDDDAQGQKRFEAFVGDVVSFDSKYLKMHMDGIANPIEYERAPHGSENAVKWYTKVREVVIQKEQSGETSEQTEAIILKHGERIVSRLLHSLEENGGFIGLENSWYLKELIQLLTKDQLDNLYKNLLVLPNPQPVDQLVSMVIPSPPVNKESRFSVHLGCLNHPKRFSNTGTPSRPLWQAIAPSPEEAVVTYYAFDPQTYQILTQPGQRLSQRQAQRLQDLGLYSQIVSFADESDLSK